MWIFVAFFIYFCFCYLKLRSYWCFLSTAKHKFAQLLFALNKSQFCTNCFKSHCVHRHLAASSSFNSNNNNNILNFSVFLSQFVYLFVYRTYFLWLVYLFCLSIVSCAMRTRKESVIWHRNWMCKIHKYCL